MKFSDYTYIRLDYTAIKAQFSDLTEQLAQASDLETTRTLVIATTKLQAIRMAVSSRYATSHSATLSPRNSSAISV